MDLLKRRENGKSLKSRVCSDTELVDLFYGLYFLIHGIIYIIICIMGRKKATLNAFGSKKRKFHGKKIGDGRRIKKSDPEVNSVEKRSESSQIRVSETEELCRKYNFQIVSLDFMDSFVSLMNCLSPVPRALHLENEAREWLDCCNNGTMLELRC